MSAKRVESAASSAEFVTCADCGGDLWHTVTKITARGNAAVWMNRTLCEGCGHLLEEWPARVTRKGVG